jgi:hypothetical protein
MHSYDYQIFFEHVRLAFFFILKNTESANCMQHTQWSAVMQHRLATILYPHCTTHPSEPSSDSISAIALPTPNTNQQLVKLAITMLALSMSTLSTNAAHGVPP